MSYVNQGWGNHHTNYIANKVDHLAEKIAFAVDMVKNASMSLESAQQELIAMSNAPYPPQSGQLLSLSSRIATCKKQIDDGLLKIQEMARAIDMETDNIQTNSPKAW